MLGPDVRVGFVHAGGPSDEQRAALAWLEDGPATVRSTTFEAAAAGTDADVLWWHRAAPLSGGQFPEPAADAVDTHLAAGGGVLLSSRAPAAVETLGIDPVPPDAVGVEGISEPTGVLWRSLYDDHPAVGAVDGLRAPLCERGEVAVARYDRDLPADGEPLAGTVRGGADVPGETSVVGWDVGGGVLGVGAPLSFAAEGGAARESFAAGCLAALAGDGGQPGRPETAAAMRALRAAVADHHRPTYHLTPPANWLNDPNGLVRWNGRYHAFYQYNPAGPYHDTIHWGHAVSDDLLRWRDRPVALAPSPDGPDRDGCWSGAAVDDDGTATVLYTGGRGRDQLPCLATSDDPGLRRWEKCPDNPVIAAPPDDPELLATDDWAAEFRDHSLWRAGGRWHQLVGAGVADRGGAALHYTSPDLREWRYEGPLLVGDDGHGTVWECPELLPLDGADLLHVSDYDDVRYFLGQRRDGGFDVDRAGVLDPGEFYAPQSLRDGDRHVTFGWLPETRDGAAQWDAGWSGALSLPRVLSVGPDGRLRQRPAPEVTDLRDRRLDADPPATLADERVGLAGEGRRLELDLEVALDDAVAFELSVFESADRAERTAVRYTAGGELLVDRSAASRAGVGTTEPVGTAVPPHDEPLSLRAFLDGSVLELFANDRHCMTSRVYPAADSTGLSVAAEGGRATVDRLAAWVLEPAVTDPPR